MPATLATAGPVPDLLARRPPAEPLAGRARPAPGRSAAADEGAATLLWAQLLPGEPLALADVVMLTSLAQWRSVVPGQLVLDSRVEADALVALARGEAALGLRAADGHFHPQRMVRGPAWLDSGSAWLPAAHAMDALAQSGATLLALPRALLAARLPQHPALALRFITVLAGQVQALSASTQELMHKDAPSRLAHWLHQRLEPVAAGAAVPAGQAVVHLLERKRDVASQLAITPETLSRLMRSLQRQGVIEVAGYTVRVLDIAALAQLAAG